MLRVLADDLRMAEVFLGGGAADPVPPADLALDDSNSLVARVVAEVLEEDPPSENREVYRPDVNPYATFALVPKAEPEDESEEERDETVPEEEVEDEYDDDAYGGDEEDDVQHREWLSSCMHAG